MNPIKLFKISNRCLTFEFLTKCSPRMKILSRDYQHDVAIMSASFALIHRQFTLKKQFNR